MTRTLTLSFILPAALLSPLPAENWPQWRGPQGDGTSPEVGLAERWSRTENVAWRLELPGPAGSTPCVWGERIFLTSVEGSDLVLIAVSTAGKELWKKVFGSGSKNARGDEGNSAAPSPSTDGKHVWTYAGTGDLACFDVEGKQVWKANLEERYGAFDHWHGMSSTPLVVGDRLYQMCLRMKDPYIVALEALSGKELWKRARETDAEHESRHSYASPVLYRDGERSLLIIHGADYVGAHRLEDGEEVWRCGSLNPREDYNRFLRFVASPACAPGLVVAPSAKGNPVVAVKPDGRGDLTRSAHVAWRRGRDTPDVPTPAIHDGLVYLLRENGVMICVEAKTGEQVYHERLHRSRQRASPMVAEGRVYCASRDGEVFVVRAGRKFEVLAANDMGEAIASTPVAAGGRLYLRTFKALYAVALPERKKA